MNHTLDGPDLRWQIEIEARAAEQQRQASLEQEQEALRLQRLLDAERAGASGLSRGILFAVALAMAILSLIAVHALALHGLTLIPGGKP